MKGKGWPTYSPISWTGHRAWHPNAVLEDLRDDDFNRFMRNVLARCPGYVTAMFESYTVPALDFVGRQEDLVEDLLAVLRLLNEDFEETRIRELAPVNVSRTPRQEVLWEEPVRRLVEQHERDGIVRFGYAAERPSLPSRAGSSPRVRDVPRGLPAASASSGGAADAGLAY
jgi:hypothetical protein